MPLTFGPFLLDDAGRRLLRDGDAVSLQPKAFDLLWLLADRAGELVSHDDIHAALWPGVHLGDEALPQMVFRVRSALGDVRPYRYVEGVPRRGYRLAAPVARVGAVASSLVGRDADLGRVLAALGRPGVVVLVGAGGIGKTALAREAAARLSGAVWVDLVDAADVSDLVRSAARALGVPVGERAQSLRAAVLAAVAERSAPVLLVDNAEHLADAVVAWVREVCGAQPGARLLITSRRDLALPATTIELGPLSGDAGLAVYERVSGAPIAPDHRADAAALVDALDGSPLAIELAASRAAVLAPRELLARLDQLGVLRRGAGRADDLDASVAWSWALLPEAPRRALTTAALLTPPFSLAAMEAALGEPVLDPLQELVAHRLVRRDEGAFRLPAAVLFFATRRLAEAVDRPERAARYAAWLVGHAEAALCRFDADPTAADLDLACSGAEPLRRVLAEGLDAPLWARCAAVAARLMAERGPFDVGFDLAMRALTSPEPPVAIAAAVVAMRLAAFVNRQQEAIEAVDGVLGRVPPGPRADALRIRRLALGAQLGDAAAAESLFAFPEPADTAAFVTLRRFQGAVHGRAGRMEEAQACLRAAVAACRSPDLGLDRAFALGLLGNVVRALGRPREALGLHEESLVLFDRIGVVSDYGVNLANTWAALGEHERAAEVYAEVVTRARAFRAVETELLALGNAATGLAEQGRHAEALAAMRAVLYRLGAPELARRRLWALQNVGILCRYVGRAWEAETVLRDALELARAHGADVYVTTLVPELAATVADLGRPDEAVVLLAAGGRPELLAVARAHVALARGDRAGAVALLHEARALDPAGTSVRALAARLGQGQAASNETS